MKDVREDEQPMETHHEHELGEREANIRPDVRHMTDVNQLAEVAHGEADEVVAKESNHRRRGDVLKADIVAQGVRNARRAGGLDPDPVDLDTAEGTGEKTKNLPTQVLDAGAGFVARASELATNAAASAKGAAASAGGVAARAAHLGGDSADAGREESGARGGDGQQQDNQEGREEGDEGTGPMRQAVDVVAGSASRMLATVRESVAGLSQAATSG